MPEPTEPAAEPPQMVAVPGGKVQVGEILGSGTQDDPYRPPVRLNKDGKLRKFRTIYGVRQCDHEGCGKWYWPQLPNAVYCPFHGTKERSHHAAKSRSSRRKREPRAAIPKMTVEVEWAEAQRRFRAIGLADRGKLGNIDSPKTLQFGKFGEIRCTERVRLAAELAAQGYPAAIIVAYFNGCDDSDRFGPTDYNEIQQTMPFRKMRSHYYDIYRVANLLTEEIPKLERDIDNARQDPRVNPNQIVMASIRITDLRSTALSLMERPPERKTDKEFTEIGDVERRARKAVSNWLRTLPGDPRTNRQGGPGERM